MNKKGKIVSTLALASILTATGINGIVSAATTNDTTITKSLGIYRNLVSGSNPVVPYVIKNRDDKVTIKDITDQYEVNSKEVTKFNGSTTIPVDTTIVKTGDTFEIDGTTYRVVVYGDVNGDGSVTIGDALALFNHVGEVEGKTITDVLKLEAGNVDHDSKVSTIADALQLFKYVGEVTDTLVVNPPEVKDDTDSSTVTPSNYKISLKSDKYINSINQTSLTLAIKLNDSLGTAKTGMTIQLADTDGVKVEYSFDINAGDVDKDYFEEILSDTSTDLKSTKKIADLADGKIVIKLLDDDGSELDKIIVEKHADTANLQARVLTKRNTNTAEVNVVSYGESDAVKMYYAVDNSDAPADANAVLNGYKNKTDKRVKVADIKDNEATFTVSAKENDELATDTAYTLYYVLVDEYGNNSKLLTTTIAKDTATVMGKVTISEDIDNGVFTWTNPTSNNGSKIVTLYKDGEIVLVLDALDNTTKTGDRVKSAMQKEKGTYRLGIITIGNGVDTANSEEVMSEEVVVDSLSSVKTTLSTRVDETDDTVKVYLDWDSNNNFNKVQYVYTVEKLDTETGEYKTVESTETAVTGTISAKEDLKKATVVIPDTKIGYDDVYRVKVVAKSTDTSNIIADSEAEYSNSFFRLSKTNFTQVMDETTDTSITFELTKEIKVNGKRANYTAEVYKITDNVAYDINGNVSGATITGVTPQTKQVTVTDNKITIEGLDKSEDGKQCTYIIKLIAEIDGIKGESEYISGSKTYITAPNLNRDLTVVSSKNDISDNTLFIDSDGYYIGTRKIIKLASIDNEYGTKFADKLAMIKKLNLEAGDIINVSDSTVSITLNQGTSSSKTLTIDAVDRNSKEMEGLKFEITGTKTHERAIQVNVGDVTLKGASAEDLFGAKAYFSIATGGVHTAGQTRSITLNSKVFVRVAANNSENLVLAQGTEKARINGVLVSASATTEMKATLGSSASAGRTFDVKANNSTLVFENTANTGDLAGYKDTTINFVGDNTARPVQLGSIEIKTTDGKVTLTSDSKTNVDANVRVEVNNGEVEVSGTNYTGTKTITVNNEETTDTSKVTAISKVKTPSDLYGKTVTLKESYSEEDIDSLTSSTDKEVRGAIRDYLASFGVTKGTVAIGNDSTTEYQVVTFTFTGKCDFEILNIK